jgi:hypothetical protein
MEKSLTTVGTSLAGPSLHRKVTYKNITPTERELIEFCGGDLHLLRVALRVAIRERTKLLDRP